MSIKRTGYKVAITDIKNVCMEIFNNTNYNRNRSITEMCKRSEVSYLVFTKILSLLEAKNIAYKVGTGRSLKVVWNRSKSSPNETMFLNIHNEYYKKIQKEKKADVRTKMSLSRCLSFLKNNGFEGEIYKIKFEDNVKVKTTYIL